jgi:hypothetical protein
MTNQEKLAEEIEELTKELSKVLERRNVHASLGALAALTAFGVMQLDKGQRSAALSSLLKMLQAHLRARTEEEGMQ